MRREGTSIGQFRIERLLGHGGMGTVYVAVDEMTGREVAVKLLRPDLTSNDGFVDRFKAEARTLARLDHPRIARLHGFFRHDDDLLMVMEYVRGTTLADLLRSTGAVAPETAVRWVHDVLDALHYAHAEGVIHRDVKPANIIIEEQTGRARLTDFGIARSEADDRLTQTGQTVGTIAYMAPEQVMSTDADGRADLYAVGVVLFELLTGRIPYSATTTFTLMREVADGVPAQALDRLPAEAAPLRPVLRQALASDPASRFADGHLFAGALRQAWRDDTAAPDPVMHPTAATTVAQTVAQTAARTVVVPVSAERRATSPALLGVGAVAVALVLGLAMWLTRRETPPVQSTTGPEATVVATAETPAETPAASAAVAAPTTDGTRSEVPLVAARTPVASATRPADPVEQRAPVASTASATAAAPAAAAPTPAEPDEAPTAAATRPPAEFGRSLLMLEVTEDEETETEEVEVLLRFDGQRLVVLNAETRVPLERLTYRGIGTATYSQVQSRVRLFRGPAHWLDLQAGGRHVVLRLDKRNFSEILDELEARTGRRVLRAERR